ncbi:DotI/IcmL family type IV secretion protein [Psychromonas sp. SP041]|uniref:DotI/IcmL family type IV secretion protein n=1 Tax=Psychromonas sp. SP041 TaxID=1365007 RepID=UPI0010C7E1C1|nr:DotI/IcmL family type IV secretion protein [Psychromonas sp. SP041]
MSDKKKILLKKGVKPEKQDKTKKERGTTNDPLIDVELRKLFYKDQYTKMTKMAAASLICFATSIAGVTYSVMKEPGTVYIAVNEDKTLTKLIPLSRPNQKDSVVASWLSNSLVDTFDFSYSNIKSHLNQATMEYFTDSGRQELLNALEKTGNLKAIVDRKMIVSLSIDSVPLILKKGKPSFSNRYLWKIEAQATLTYRTEAKEFSNKVLFTVTVARDSLLSNSSGIGIHRIVIEKQEQ